MVFSPSVRRWLIGLAAMLAITTLYRAWSATSELEQTLERAERELLVARDSLAQAQLQIDYLVQEIGSSQRALRIISQQVLRAHEQYDAQRAQGAGYRQPLQQRWQQEQQTRRALQRAAQKYSVE